MYVCVFYDVCVYMHMYRHVQARHTCQGTTSCVSPPFCHVWDGVPYYLLLCTPGKRALEVPGILLYLRYHPRNTVSNRSILPHMAFMWVLGMQTRVSMLAQQAIYPLSHLLSMIFFYLSQTFIIIFCKLLPTSILGLSATSILFIKHIIDVWFNF